MPYETIDGRNARQQAKKSRAKELAEQQRELQRSVEAATLTTLRAQYLRSLSEIAALLGGISERTAADITRRPDFPRPKNISGRVRLYETRAVLAWISMQPEGRK